GRGRHPEARELGRVLAAGLERLVGEERDAAARRAQGREAPGGTGDQAVAQVDGAVEVEEPAAVGETRPHPLTLPAPPRGEGDHRKSGMTADWARSKRGTGATPSCTTPQSATARASAPENDGAITVGTPSGSRMYMNTMRRR